MEAVSQYMTKNPFSIQSGSSLADAVKLMREKKIGAIFINDAEGKTLGIFTERDLLNRVSYDDVETIRDLRIDDVMTQKLITVTDDEKYMNVLELMKSKNLRHLPVMEGQRVVGVVSARDMMRLYSEHLESEVAHKESELKKSMKKIQESEELFRGIFNNSAVAVTFADANECITAWNPYAEKLLDMDENDLLNKPLKDLYDPEGWKHIRECNIRHYGIKDHLETRVINKNGEFVDVDISISVVKNAEGEITGSIGVMRDIRTRKSIAKLLEYSMKELEDLKFGLDVHALVATSDKEGRMTYTNEKFCETSGYLKNELIGQDFRFINAGYHSKEFFRDLWHTVQYGKIWKGEIKNKSKDGSFFWVDTTIVPFIDVEGQPYQYLTIRNDVTERKRYEEELETANKDLATNAKMFQGMVIDREKINQKLRETQKQIIQVEKMATLGTLAAGFAHEIKNPLAIILQGVEMVEKIFVKLEQKAYLQYVKIIRSAAERANSVVTSLLRYSRSSQMEESEVNVCEVIDAAVELITNNVRMRGINIVKAYPADLCLMFGDHIMLQQVFFDLMNNSIDAMPNGGEISLSVDLDAPPNAQQEEKNIIVKLKDSGEGIDEKTLAKIFDPFFTTKDEGKGTGLGLSTVFLILQRHNGNITVQSKKNAGTTFTITLPVMGKPV